MRNPDRLYVFYDQMREIHMRYAPDWRFAQMMYNIFGRTDIFYLEEEDVIERIRTYFEKGV